MSENFAECPYREQTLATLSRHEEMLNKMDDRITKLETTVGTIDEILKRLEIAVDKLTGNINKVLIGAIIIPIVTALVMNLMG